MNREVIHVLTFSSALGCGLVAGVLFAFSAFVMKALSDLPAAQGIAAMQAINAAAPSPLFMTALFATAGGCVVLAASSLASLHETPEAVRVAGCVLYLVAIAITIFYHVPLNDGLATFHPTSAEAARSWSTYGHGWTMWNHVRTTLALAAAAALTVALELPNTR